MRSRLPIVSALFHVLWIFIGNYILLNLFLAIMLDAFGEYKGEIDDDDDDDEKDKTETKTLFSEESRRLGATTS